MPQQNQPKDADKARTKRDAEQERDRQPRQGQDNPATKKDDTSRTKDTKPR